MFKETEIIIKEKQFFCDVCGHKINELSNLYDGGSEGYNCVICEKDYCIHCYPKKEIIIKMSTFCICENCNIKKDDKLIQQIDKYIRQKEELNKIEKEIINVFRFKKYDLSGRLRK